MPFTPREQAVVESMLRFGHGVRWGLYVSERVTERQVRRAAAAAELLARRTGLGNV